eukprot:9450801-Prorocentrum_lima.AAC.1
MMIRREAWVRNMSISYGGKTLAEFAFGRRPPDIRQAESMDPASFRQKCRRKTRHAKGHRSWPGRHTW